jgi:acetoin utilization deacetylase AcuC-like enzyme
MSTGIFFHYQRGERLRDFPQALGKVLARDNVFLYDAFYPSKPDAAFEIEPVSSEALLKVHSRDMIARVKATGDHEGALYSAAGSVAAAKRVFTGELKNAFVFTGFGDHHAGSTFYSGGCYFNGAAIAVHELRDKFGVNRFAIIDTDAHHGDGTWELFKGDSDVLYLCLCDGLFGQENGNVNIHIPLRTQDEGYLIIARHALERWLKPFCPEIIFWNWGYDGTKGEYGDMGLTPSLHVQLASEIRKVAEEVSEGRLIVILCGGRRRDFASLIIPRVIEVLID